MEWSQKNPDVAFMFTYDQLFEDITRHFPYPNSVQM